MYFFQPITDQTSSITFTRAPSRSTSLVSLAGCGLFLSVTLMACSSNDEQVLSAEQAPVTGPVTGPDLPETPDSGSGNLPVTLPPLPVPALTAAPSATDDPLPEPAQLSTVSGFQLVANQGEPLPAVMQTGLSDADFAAGTPAPVIETPAGLDPATNTAPFFEGIENLQVDAGELLEIVYRPLDTDGDLPGMFPNNLPRGASFDDNRDGSKTFRWTPLQADVGVREFAVTAIDAQNASYQYTQNIRIKVVLPIDQSTIPNEAPFLDRLPDFSYTVRVSDPVVIELRGIDRNGTTPIIEIPSPPVGALFTAHPKRNGVFVLNFVPATAGPLNLQVLLRDELDATLVTTETFSINVVSQDYPIRTGNRLKDLASARSMLFGYAASQNYYHQPDGALYADIAAAEFNFVTPESSMKMDTINPLPGRYDFADTDNLMSFARLNNMQVHGHPLVWYRQNPPWIQNAPLSNLQGHMQEHIHRLMTRYKDDVVIWDVVNEPIGDNGGLRDSIWLQAMGESYIDIALLQARATDPEATLLINEFDAGVPGPKRDSLFELLNNLKTRNTPLDGVGFQLHVFSDFDQFEDIRQSFQRVADLGLDIYITELDVAMTGAATREQQANVYQQLVGLCLEQARCKAVQFWGFTDQYSFRRMFNPLLFDRTYQEKPAYTAVQQRLGL